MDITSPMSGPAPLVLHDEKGADQFVEQADEKWAHNVGKEGADLEHKLTPWEALRGYPGAVIWSILLSTAIIMEGYDIVLIGNLFAQPAFQRRYGNYYPTLGYQISGPWQVGLGNATACGTIIGALANGWLTHRFGYRRVLLVSIASVTGFIFITFFAQNLPMLMAGSTLCGLPWGVFATMVMPTTIRVAPGV